MADVRKDAVRETCLRWRFGRGEVDTKPNWGAHPRLETQSAMSICGNSALRATRASESGAQSELYGDPEALFPTTSMET